MQQNIIPISENSIIALGQTKSAIALTDKLLDKNTASQDDDAWIERLWKWADENGIDDADEFDLFCLGNDETRFALAKKDNGLLGKIKEFNKLSERQVSVLYLKYWQNNSTDEISAKICCGKPRVNYFLNVANNILCQSAKNKLPKSKKYLLSCSRVLLEGLNLSKLPSELFNLKNLESLRLFLPLQELYHDIDKLVNLKELDITSSVLRELPNSFIRLKNLDFLFLSCENFEKLPESIENMKSLKTIWIWDSQIQELPKNIFDSKTLTDIQIKGKLAELPESNSWQFIDWEDENYPLIHLDFGENNLKSLPTSFAYLRHAYLNIKNNPLGMTEELRRLIKIMESNGCQVEI